MEYLVFLVQTIGIAILLSGLVMSGFGVYRYLMTKRLRVVCGDIVDYTQEYTTRGFIRKAKIEYSIDENKYFYITESKTFKRGSGKIKLYVKNDGSVIEPFSIIQKIIFGVLLIILACTVLHVANEIQNPIIQII